jgi:hypothetical protein
MGTDSPTTGGGGVNLNSINRNDLAVMIAGFVAFIASFFPYVGVSVGPIDVSRNAWHGYATLGLLLMFIAAILIAVTTFAGSSMPKLPAGIHVIAAALAALGTLLVILRAFTYDSGVPGIDISVKWGAYVVFIAGIAETVFAILGMRESGEEIPGVNRGGGTTAA